MSLIVRICPECGEELITRGSYPYCKNCDNDYNEDELYESQMYIWS